MSLSCRRRFELFSQKSVCKVEKNHDLFKFFSHEEVDDLLEVAVYKWIVRSTFESLISEMVIMEDINGDNLLSGIFDGLKKTDTIDEIWTILSTKYSNQKVMFYNKDRKKEKPTGDGNMHYLTNHTSYYIENDQLKTKQSNDFTKNIILNNLKVKDQPKEDHFSNKLSEKVFEKKDENMSLLSRLVSNLKNDYTSNLMKNESHKFCENKKYFKHAKLLQNLVCKFENIEEFESQQVSEVVLFGIVEDVEVMARSSKCVLYESNFKNPYSLSSNIQQFSSKIVNIQKDDQFLKSISKKVENRINETENNIERNDNHPNSPLIFGCFEQLLSEINFLVTENAEFKNDGCSFYKKSSEDTDNDYQKYSLNNLKNYNESLSYKKSIESNEYLKSKVLEKKVPNIYNGNIEDSLFCIKRNFTNDGIDSDIITNNNSTEYDSVSSENIKDDEKVENYTRISTANILKEVMEENESFTDFEHRKSTEKMNFNKEFVKRDIPHLENDHYKFLSKVFDENINEHKRNPKSESNASEVSRISLKKPSSEISRTKNENRFDFTEKLINTSSLDSQISEKRKKEKYIYNYKKSFYIFSENTETNYLNKNIESTSALENIGMFQYQMKEDGVIMTQLQNIAIVDGILHFKENADKNRLLLYNSSWEHEIMPELCKVEKTIKNITVKDILQDALMDGGIQHYFASTPFVDLKYDEKSDDTHLLSKTKGMIILKTFAKLTNKYILILFLLYFIIYLLAFLFQLWVSFSKVLI